MNGDTDESDGETGSTARIAMVTQRTAATLPFTTPKQEQ